MAVAAPICIIDSKISSTKFVLQELGAARFRIKTRSRFEVRDV